MQAGQHFQQILLAETVKKKKSSLSYPNQQHFKKFRQKTTVTVDVLDTNAQVHHTWVLSFSLAPTWRLLTAYLLNTCYVSTPVLGTEDAVNKWIRVPALVEFHLVRGWFAGANNIDWRELLFMLHTHTHTHTHSLAHFLSLSLSHTHTLFHDFK